MGKTARNVAIAGGLGLLVWGGLRLLAKKRSDWDLDALVQRELELAASIVGLSTPSLIPSSLVETAACDGVRVYYNRDWIRAVIARNCDEVACVKEILLGVMGHELGHLVGGDIGAPAEERPSRELRADAVAAVVLARSGASDENFARVISEITGCCSPGYPPGWQREQTIRKTFAQAQWGLA